MCVESKNSAEGKRRKGVEERCARKGGSGLAELRTSKNGFESWRIRQLGFVG